MHMASSQKKPISNILSREHLDEKGLFLTRVGKLLEEGYSLKDALNFLEKIEKEDIKTWIKVIQADLETGGTFHETLEKIGYSSKICSQIYFAYQFGDYAKTITRCGQQMLDNVEREKKIRSLLAYPILLVSFLLGMLMLMRFLVLPHMENLFGSTASEESLYSNYIVRLVYYSPQIIIGICATAVIVYFISRAKLEKLEIIDRYKFFMKLPIVHLYLKDYWTHFFFFEWSQLFKNGSSFQEIVSIMQAKDASELLQETGSVLAAEMKLGKSIHESVSILPYFHEEALLVIAHGENTGKLSIEMSIYANYCENELTTRVEKLMVKIQPVIFGFVALMIIAIYGALLLPVFSLMEGI